MSRPEPHPPRPAGELASGAARWRPGAAIAGRWILGGLMLWMGLSKALDPVHFLKLVRQYELVSGPPWVNAVAAGLPWFEALCGLFLLAGVAVRGTALVSLLLLLPFTALVWRRALELQARGGLPFCAIRFDCGCGAGEVYICAKLAENLLLILLSAFLVWQEAPRWALAYRLVGRTAPPA